jgi:hypothetical protein
MTGYTVHTGTSKKFVSGWDKVFGNAQEKKSTANAKGKAKGEKGKTVKKKKK